MKKECNIQADCLVLEAAKVIKKMSLHNILYFYIKDEYACIVLDNGKEYLTNDSLKSIETDLPDYFYRINKSVIVNLNYCEYIYHPNQPNEVLMKEGIQFGISRRRLAGFKEAFRKVPS